MEQSLQQRIEARLAKHKQLQQSSLTQTQLGMGNHIPPKPASTIPIKASTALLQQNTPVNNASASVQQMSNDLTNVSQNYTDSQRELTQTRTRLLSIERQSVNYQNELSQKDQALRRTLSEANGERTALVDALGESRVKNDQLIIELDRSNDIIQKQEVRIAKMSQEFQEIQGKFVKTQTDLQAQQYDQKYMKEQINMLETKISISESENKKYQNELNELRDTGLENKILKNKVAQLEHEFNSVSNKYKGECDNNTNIRAEYVQLKQEYAAMLSKFADQQEQYNTHKQLQIKYDELLKTYQNNSKVYREQNQEFEDVQQKLLVSEKSLSTEKNAISTLAIYLKQLLSGQINNSFTEEIQSLKQQSIDDTFSYQQLQQIMTKSKQLVDQLHQTQNEQENTNQFNNQYRKELQIVTSNFNDLQIKCDALSEQYEQLLKSSNIQNQELQQQKLNNQQLTQQNNKQQLDLQLTASAISNAVGKQNLAIFGGLDQTQINNQEMDIGKYLQCLQQFAQKQQKQIEKYEDEQSNLLQKHSNLEIVNNQQLEQLQQLQEDNSQYKTKHSKFSETTQKLEFEVKNQKQLQCNVSQLVMLIIKFINQYDRKYILSCQQNKLANVLLNNYLIEQSQVKEQLLLQQDKKQARLEIARRKLRVGVFCAVFIVKLKQQKQAYQNTLNTENQSILQTCNSNHESNFIQLSSLVQPYIIQQGDLQTGLLNINDFADQRQLMNKLVTQYLSNSTANQYYCNQQILNLNNSNYVFFNSSIKLIKNVQFSELNKVKLLNTELIAQNNLQNTQLDQYKQSQQSNINSIALKEAELIKLKQGIEQFYVSKQQFELQIADNTQLTQRLNEQTQQINLIQHQLNSQNVDMGSQRNEINRLQDQLQQSDKLVKTISDKYDNQVKTQLQLKELILNYETQIKQKEQQYADLQQLLANLQQDQSKLKNVINDTSVQHDNLRQQLEQRDRLINDLQIQIEKENRLRVISEQQLLKEKDYKLRMPTAAPRYDSLLPMHTNITSNPGLSKQFQTTKTEIKDLISQLNQSLDDEL